MKLQTIVESGAVPDFVLRAGIRRLLRRRLRDEAAKSPAEHERFQTELDASPLAVETRAANEQHYEVDADFYGLVLGRHRKYSSCLYAPGVESLDEAEAAMLELTVRRARIADGDRVLELGCGWGSLSLWMAERFPRCRITALSNSHSQRAFIENECRRRRLSNLEVVTCDINEFRPIGSFQRVVSVEMFEHLRNHRKLFRRIAEWLDPNGTLFVHVFTHREFSYLFETEGDDNWLGAHFFTGGMMPSDSLLTRCQDAFELREHWRESGLHYQRTAEAWLTNLDRNRSAVLPILTRVYGVERAKAWLRNWRVFFMACAELWGYDEGREWLVSHYLFEKR